jgi:hypothetical protein
MGTGKKTSIPKRSHYYGKGNARKIWYTLGSFLCPSSTRKWMVKKRSR